MGRRFNDLEARLRTYLSTGASLDACQDIELKNYGKWKLFQDPSARDLPAASERDKRGQSLLMIDPFDETLMPATSKCGVILSGRSKAWVNNKLATFGLIAFDKDKARWLGFYTPAKAYVRPSTATKATNQRKSRITQKNYKSKFSAGDEGYTVPFGKVGASSYREVTVGISAVAGTGIARFTPEIVKTPTDTSS